MSNNKTILFIFIFFILGVVTTFLYHSARQKYTHKEECSATIVVYYKNVRANLSLNFMYTLAEHQGVVAVSGTYFEDNQLKGKIRRDVSYVWSENEDAHYLRSVSIDKYEEIETLPDALLANILPDFYVRPNESVSYTIFRLNGNGLLFSVGNRPVFYCSR